MCAAIDIISVGPFSESFAWCQVANVMQRQLCVAIDLGRIVSFNHLELHIKKKRRKPFGLFWLLDANVSGRKSYKICS